MCICWVNAILKIDLIVFLGVREFKLICHYRSYLYFLKPTDSLFYHCHLIETADTIPNTLQVVRTIWNFYFSCLLSTRWKMMPSSCNVAQMNATGGGENGSAFCSETLRQLRPATRYAAYVETKQLFSQWGNISNIIYFTTLSSSKWFLCSGCLFTDVASHLTLIPGLQVYCLIVVTKLVVPVGNYLAFRPTSRWTPTFIYRSMLLAD